MREADYDTWDRLVPKAKRVDLPADRLITARGRGDSAAVQKNLQAISNDARSITFTTRYLWIYYEDDALAEAAGRAGLGKGPPAFQPMTALALAELDLARGRWSAAKRKLLEARRLHPFYAQTMKRVAATLPFLEIPERDLQQIRDEIEAWDGSTPARTDVTVQAMMPHARLYLLALLDARLEDYQRAMSRIAELEALPDPVGQPAVVRDLVRTIRAQIAFQEGRHAEVVSLLQPVHGQIPLPLLRRKEVVPTDYIFSQDHARYLRAVSLRELGQLEDAVQWLSSSFIGVTGEMVYRAALHRQLALAYQQLGDGEKAQHHEARFKRAWANADAPMR